MQKRFGPSILLMVLGLALIIGACTTATDAPAPTDPPAAATDVPPPDTEVPPPAELVGDPLRGGLMYDKWWVVLGADTPEDDHPLWATQDTNTRSGKDTWRCKECHGWDYKGAEGAYSSGSHSTGFPGVFSLDGADPSEILDALTGGVNPDHDFSTVMDEQALVDMALFISQEMLDSSLVIEDKMALSDDLETGEALYLSTCADCHGEDGRQINFGAADDPDYVGTIATDNPWEFIHKMRFGQPGTGMPSSIDIGWSLDEIGAVLAFAQTLPTEAPENVDPAAIAGGLLYDKWWAVLGLDAPEDDNPLWATQDTNTRSGKDTWRCKECHGWDYQGADGAYGSGSHFTGFTGVYQASEMSTEDIVAWLSGGMNPDHDFSMFMDEDTLGQLAAFLQNGMIDMSLYINEDKSANGNAENGETLYAATCTPCHGADGTQINFGSADDPTYIGGLANGNPWEFIHKASFGQPASSMPSGRALGWSTADLADLLAFAQTLP